MRKCQSVRADVICEACESRRLFAVPSASLQAGVLTITGTTGNDQIDVTRDLGKLRVRVSDQWTYIYNYAAVTDRINVKLGNGADRYTANIDVKIFTTVWGGSGNDTITSGAGGSYVYGESGNDSIRGLSGKDYLYGGNGHDTLKGYDGDDYLWGGQGEDYLSGEGGNDSLFANDDDYGSRPDIYTGGSGRDSLWYNYPVGSGRSIGVNVSLDGIANDGYPGENDSVNSSIESIAGTRYGDRITLGAMGGSANGLEGSDTLHAGTYNSTLQGGTGNDFLYGKQGADAIYGNADNDYVSAGSGNDTVFGGSGNDDLRGGSGNDKLSGDAGFDRLFGDSGKDSLYGGTENDRLYADDDVLGEIVDGGTGAHDWADVDFYAGIRRDVVTSIETVT